MPFDWNKRAGGDARQKEQFHSVGRTRLRQLAKAMGFQHGTFDIRSNKGGPAVSGEVTLHHDEIYIQIAQSAMGSNQGVLIRTCKGRKDYTGGPNHFAPLALLDDVDAMARRVRTIMPSTRTDEHLDSLSDDENSEYYRRLK